MEFQQLELLSLVSKISQELANHVGTSDKALAEYIIHLHEESKSLDEFKQKLDSGFSDSFMENLDRLILRMHPNHPRKEKTNKAYENNDKKKTLFKGLSLPDQQRDWDAEEREAKKMKRDVKEMDNMLDQLPGSLSWDNGFKDKSTAPSRKRERSPSPDYRDRRIPQYRDTRRSPEY